MLQKTGIRYVQNIGLAIWHYNTCIGSTQKGLETCALELSLSAHVAQKSHFELGGSRWFWVFSCKYACCNYGKRETAWRKSPVWKYPQTNFSQNCTDNLSPSHNKILLLQYAIVRH